MNTTSEFQFNNETTENDFVILKLESPLILDKNVQPACLPPSKAYLDMSSTKESCFTSGWGRLQDNGTEPEKCQYVQVPAISNPACKSAYGLYENGDDVITDSMICAGYPGEGGRDACQGDSGGPLVCNDGDMAIIAGVVSFGDKCGDPETPGVYSRVTHVLDWIIAQMVS